MNEFNLIKKYLAPLTAARPDVICGIGDDAALLNMPAGYELAITTDTLVAGVHFIEEATPYDIGYKSLAVNLSDLAAMGATPAWITLALTLPHAKEDWLASFCNGLSQLARTYQVQLIGGDLTQGPLSITIQAMGFVPQGKALLRSKASPHDLIYVTGAIGDAGLALKAFQEKNPLPKAFEEYFLQRLNRPEPRIEMGQALLSVAHAAIDISDGLAADLGHILEASKVGAIVFVDQLPLSKALKLALPPEKAIALALTSGDDYELCFTLPANKQQALDNQLSALPCRYTCIGEITAVPGLLLRYQNGNPYHGHIQGYQHF